MEARGHVGVASEIASTASEVPQAKYRRRGRLWVFHFAERAITRAWVVGVESMDCGASITSEWSSVGSPASHVLDKKKIPWFGLPSKGVDGRDGGGRP